MRRWGTVLALACLCVSSPARSQDRAQTVADLSWPLLTLEGRRTSLAPLRGRVVIVNSWATWCEPCVAELASMQVLRAAVPDTLLAFALVAPQRAEPVRAFVRRRAVQLPVYLEAAPPPAGFARAAVPTTWIVDRSGAIVATFRGAVDWGTPVMQRRVRELLAR